MRCSVVFFGVALLLVSASSSAMPGVSARFTAYIDAHGRLQLGDGLGFADRPSQASKTEAAVQGRRPPSLQIARQLQRQIAGAALAHGVDPVLLQAIIEVESAYDPQALSPRGAVGLMQLMPATARRFGVHDRHDIEQNLHGGAAYLAWLIRYFQQDVRLAVAAYNAGEGAVRRAGNRVPPWPQTQAYVQRVCRLYTRPVR